MAIDPPVDEVTAQRRAMLRLVSNRTAAQVVTSMRTRGVRPLLLKGAWFAHWLYDDPADRPPGDVDVIVAPADMPGARQALSALGFTRYNPPSHARETAVHHEAWEREDLGILRVELHHTLALVDADPSHVWRHVSEDTTTLGVAGTEVEVPGEAVGALLVGLHAAQHGLTLPKPQLDLERALARLDERTWHSAAQVARSLGAGAAFAAGLSLRPQGAALARRLGLDPAAAQRAVRLRGTAPGAGLTIEWVLTELRTRSGVSDRARLVGRLVVPPRARMLEGYPLAGRGPAGMVAAYLIRPIRVARMAPSGLRAWLEVAPAPGPARTWPRRCRVAVAAVLLTGARVALRLVAFRHIVRVARLTETGSAPGTHAMQDAAQEARAARAAEVAVALRSAASRLPWDCTCLTQALAGAVLLRVRRLPAVLHLGVLRNDESGEIEAHAWLTCGADMVSGGEGHDRFTEIATYASAWTL
jgi:hypothetical protein